MFTTKVRALLESHYGWVVVFTFATLALFITPLGPVLMQDELVYSQQVLSGNGEGADFPNYLHNFLFSLTNQCGPLFYQCAKLGNLVLTVLTALAVYWVSVRVLPRWKASLASLLALVSSSTTFASMFMPESLYILLSVLSMVLVWIAVHDYRYLWLAGLVLALATLTKPHALILVLCLTAYVVTYPALKQKKFSGFAPAWKFGMILIGSFTVSRIALGLWLAGVPGLDLIGPKYGRFLERILSEPVLETPSSLLASATAVISATESSMGFFNVFIAHIFVFIVFSAALFLVPALAIYGRITQPELRHAETHDLSDLFALTTYVLVPFAIAIAAFGALLTMTGDDHSVRFMTRYFDFVFLFAPIFWLAIDGSRPWPSNMRATIAIASLIAVTLLALTPTVSGPGLIDSPSLFSLLSQGATRTLLIVVVTVALAFLWSNKTRSIGIGVALSSLIGLPSVTAFGELADRSKMISDTGLVRTGVVASSLIPTGKSVAIYAVSKKDAEFVSFGLRSRDVTISILESTTRLIPKEVVVDYVLALNSTFMGGKYEFAQPVGTGVLYRVARGESFQFPGIPNPVSLVIEANGLSGPNVLGSWIGPNGLVMKVQPLALGATLKMSLFTMPGSAETTKGALSICDLRMPFELPSERALQTADIPVTPDLEGCTSITIELATGAILGINGVSVESGE